MTMKLGVIATLIGTLLLAACNSGSGGTSGVSAVTSLSGGVSRTLTALSSGAPHVITTGPVTAATKYENWQLMLQKLFPKAFAVAVGLNSVWDPTPGTPITGANLSVINTYHGGNPATCDGATPSMCTSTVNGVTTTYPQKIPLKAWIGQALDPKFKNSNQGFVTAFGRLRDAMKVTCAIGMLIAEKDADGLPTAGSRTISFPSDPTNILYQDFSVGGCALDSQGVLGQSANATVTAVTGGTFTKKIALNIGFDIRIYLKLDLVGGSMNFMNIEDTAAAGGRNKVSRSIVKITGMNDAATTKIMYEFSSMGYPAARNGGSACYSAGQWQCDFEMHRAFIDNNADVSYLLSHNGKPGDDAGSLSGAPTMYKQYSVAGKPRELSACSAGCSETMALSIGLLGQSNANGSAATTTSDYNACVNVSTRAITNDNTLTCGLTGTTIGRGGGVSTAVIEASRVFYAGLTGGTPNIIAATTEATDLSFTSGGDMYTAPTSH